MYTTHTVSEKRQAFITLVRLFAIFLISSLAFPAIAQQQPVSEPASVSAPALSVPSIEELDSRIKQFKESKEQQTQEDQKKQLGTLVDIYEKARAQLQEAQKYEVSLAEFQEAKKLAPERLAAIKSQLEQIPAEPNISEEHAEWSLAQIEQQFAQTEAELASARKNAADRESEAKLRTERRVEIPKLTVQAKEELEKVRKELGGIATSSESTELTEAKRIGLLCEEKALQKKTDSYAEEIASYDARGDLLAARRSLAVRQTSYYETLLKHWQKVLDSRRTSEAERAAEEARKASVAAAQSHPAIRQLAEENARLAELRTGPGGLVSINTDRTAYLKQIDNQLAEMTNEFESVKNKVKAAGFTDVIGVIMLAKRNDIPDVREYEKNIRNRRSEIAKVRFEWIEYDEQYSELEDIKKSVDSILKDLDPPISQQRRVEIEPEVQKLLETRRELLKALVNEYEIYLSTLADLDSKERLLVATANEYANYIDENILWIKSTRSLGVSDIPRALESVGWLVSPQNWYRVFQAFRKDLKDLLHVYIIAVFLFALFFITKLKLREQMKSISGAAHRNHAGQFTRTVKVFVITLILAVFPSAVLYFLGWRLAQPSHETEFISSISAGLLATAKVYFVLRFLKLFCLPQGLAIEHLGMAKTSISFLRKHLYWFTVCIVPLTFVFTTIMEQSTGAWQESLGRMVFIAELVILSIFFAIILRPQGQLMKGQLGQNQGNWLGYLRFIWFPFSVVFPLSLVLAAAIGYYYTAQQLAICMQATILLIVTAIIFFSLVMHWLILIQHKLVLKRHQDRLAAQAAGKDSQTKQPGIQEDLDIQPEPEEDPYKISLQTRRFLRAFLVFAIAIGLWLIWDKVLPALGMFQRVELWNVTVNNEKVPITLANLIFALAIILVTVVAARNILGLLEIMVLQRLPLDKGARFAIVSMSRYVIVIVGSVLAFGAIGVTWAKVQWLAAAMTVGLGFGLQEIFANFVSGLIILFEQPMRVGDTVTVGDINGKVTRIRFRATTIRAWDRKELVVPNKEFVTGRLINWTLSDTILRIEFPVGIAYGSDTAMAEKVLLEVAHSNRKVLKEPAPFVIFKDFGDSSLEFELRLFIPDLDSYLTIWHEVNVAIDKGFRKAGIEIAFPQRDLHIRSARAPIVVNKADVIKTQVRPDNPHQEK